LNELKAENLYRTVRQEMDQASPSGGSDERRGL
jgi:hypothetical protein